MLSSNEQSDKDQSSRVQNHDEDDGLVEAEDDYEEYFFKDQGDDEQYVKIMDAESVDKNDS